MHTFQDEPLLSSDGKTQLRLRICTPSAPPRGVVQLVHGISEHIERYDDFAGFLADQGFVVAGNDHLGHGKSAANEEDRGFFAEHGGWELVVGDLRKVYERLHTAYPGLPYFMFGHSMGSFLTRTYLIKYRDGLTGAVLSGTAQQPLVMARGGLVAAQQEIRRHGVRYRSALLNNMAFGSYTKRLPQPVRTPVDWLTRDEAIVDANIADPYCGFVSTAGLFADMMGGILYNQKAENVARMNKDLPVLFIAGDMDPVGDYGNGVVKAYRSFLNAGMRDVTLKLYHDGRHEMLNELNRAQVYDDVLCWMEHKIK